MNTKIQKKNPVKATANKTKIMVMIANQMVKPR